jgi:hypothetical protein
MLGVIVKKRIPSFHNWQEADRFAWDRDIGRRIG